MTEPTSRTAEGIMKIARWNSGFGDAAHQARCAPVVWGGRVVEVRNLADHSEIEVLAYPLDGSQRPKANDSGIGRFIATMPGYVESMDYPPGALMTIDGRISGSRAGKVGEAPYVFPLVKVNQSHVWTASELSSGKNNVHFGVGLGVGIR